MRHLHLSLSCPFQSENTTYACLCFQMETHRFIHEDEERLWVVCAESHALDWVMQVVGLCLLGTESAWEYEV
eukprot:m.246759 g.246759  ORF g.246759 m.246759 type:complete len:72 (+) comp15385_c0_seq3:2787-3002(+)